MMKPAAAMVLVLLLFALAASAQVTLSGNTRISGSVAVAPLATTSSLLITTTSLPNATTGTAYSEALNASGGTLPYVWAIASGSLPAGLTLVNGVIAGTPTVAGTANFTAKVTDNALTSASQALSITVAAAILPLTITTASLPNGTVGSPYSQTLNASGGAPAYTWAAANGSSSTWVASTTAGVTYNLYRGTATGSCPTLVASGLSSTSYKDLALADGTYYYCVSAVNGAGESPKSPQAAVTIQTALPAGLLLTAGTGVISGTPTLAGNSTFGQRVSDSQATTAYKSLALNIDPSASLCGPPNYACSRSDFVVAQIPTPLPSMGGTTGVNTIVTPNDFSNPIVRVTDANTNSADLNRSYHVTPSGANADNIWNTDSTMLLVTREGTGTLIAIGFNPTTMQATAKIPGFQASNVAATWSHTNPKVLYHLAGMQIIKYTFTDAVTPPTSVVLYDFASCAAAPLAASVTWAIGEVATNADDTIFATSVSTTGGGQDTATWAIAYNLALNKCSVYNTATGQVAGDWGSTGAASDSDSFKIHDAYLFKGSILDLSSGGCVAGACLSTPKPHWFWTPGTTTVTACLKNVPISGICAGHSAGGYFTFLNFNGFPKVEVRPFSNPASMSEWPANPALPASSNEVGEAHMGWQSGGPNDLTDTNSAFFATASSTPNAPATFTAPFTNTIMIYAPNGRLRRIAHCFTTGSNSSFYDQNCLGGASQDGRFFAYTSDWLNTLGAGVGNADSHRNDVFVVKPQ